MAIRTGTFYLLRRRRRSVAQLPLNVLNRSAEDELLPLAEELGVRVLVIEPLQKGRYVAELKEQSDLTLLGDDGINSWAPAQLAWIVYDPRVNSARPTKSRP